MTGGTASTGPDRTGTRARHRLRLSATQRGGAGFKHGPGGESLLGGGPKRRLSHGTARPRFPPLSRAFPGAMGTCSRGGMARTGRSSEGPCRAPGLRGGWGCWAEGRTGVRTGPMVPGCWGREAEVLVRLGLLLGSRVGKGSHAGGARAGWGRGWARAVEIAGAVSARPHPACPERRGLALVPCTPRGPGAGLGHGGLGQSGGQGCGGLGGARARVLARPWVGRATGHVV